jgi:hypothetical protein
MSWKVIQTVLADLEMLINLQVLRYLRFERKILHHGISEGNILYVPQRRSVAPGVHSPLALDDEGDSFSLIKCLLGERCVYAY